MAHLPFNGSTYRTAEQAVAPSARMFPSVLFYLNLIDIVVRASKKAKAGEFGDLNWIESSHEVLRKLEQVGIRVEISGLENVAEPNGPVVFIGNHMSMMETLVLPVVIQPIKPVTFVVKEGLLSYPVFRHVMRARNPIAVTRTNPRQDLKVVLAEGQERLQRGISVIVFPQTTRSHSFSPEQMSSIGVKLAKKAGVPLVPLALRTDCWQNGRLIKDFGLLDTARTAHFAFGKPIAKVIGKGDDEQAIVNAFIEQELQKWGVKQNLLGEK